MKMGVWGCLHPQGKKLIASLMVVIAISVFPFNDAFAGEYDDDFANVIISLGDINGMLGLVYAEETNILMQLNQRTISNTYTLRYYIEETYNDQHQMLLQLTTDTQNNSPTIRNYVSNISSKLSNIKTSIDSMSTDISTILTRQSSIATYAGNIYSRLATTNTTLSDTYTLLYNWQSSWVAYKNQLLDWGTSWNTTFGTISTNIAAINNNLITGFTSIEGKLDTIHNDLTTVNTSLNKFVKTFTDSDGTVRNVVQVALMYPNQNFAAYYEWDLLNNVLTKANNNLNQYTTYLTNISSSISSVSGYVDGIEGKLDTIHNDLTTVNTSLNKFVKTFTDSDGTVRNVVQVALMYPNQNFAAYYEWDLLNNVLTKANNNLNQYTTYLSNISGYVDGIEGKLDTIHADLNNINTSINGFVKTFTDSDGTVRNVVQVALMYPNPNFPAYYEWDLLNNVLTKANNNLNQYTTYLSNISGYVDGIEGKMDTFQTTLASLLYETEDINDGIGDVIDAINGLASPTVTLDTTAIQSKLDTIIALLSVPNDTSTIIGDLNTVNFSDDVDDLVDTISELAPFGAVLLISEEVQILASVAPVQEPSLTVPFNFFGNYNMTIDFSWLDDIKPLINYFMLFLLLASLAKISLDFVKVEAGS